MNRKLICLLMALLLLGLLAGCQCSHNWTAATCISPKFCSKCSQIEGEPLPHNWMDATCSAPKTCTGCGGTEGTTLSHLWQDATCTRGTTCSLCGSESGEVLAHQYALSNGSMHCIWCDAVDPSGKSIQPLELPRDNMNASEIQTFIDLEGQNNLRNNARFHYCDGLYYGQYWDEVGQSLFICTDINSGSAILLDYGWAKNIYVADETVYYENIQPEDSDHGIYRINMKDGQYVSREKISDSYGSMQLKGNYIYYADFSDQYISVAGDEPLTGLYHCDLDGNNVTLILNKSVQEFYVFDTGILYVDTEDGESLHLCYPDGSGDRKLNAQKSTSPIFDGEYIYYLSSLDNWGKESSYYTCWKIRPDGTDNQQVSYITMNHAFLVYNDTIYFCNAQSISQLYRMRLDGSKATSVTKDTEVYYVQILNGELKYTKFKGDYIEGNYLCGLDGKNLREFIPYA